MMCSCILIPIAVGLISALLGYLLGRLFRKSGNNNVDLSAYENKIANLKADLDACKASKSSTDSTARAASSLSATTAKTKSFDADAAKAVFGKRIKENDLKIIEGIGPKIESLFKDNGITTWAQLGASTVHKCEEILKSGGDRFKLHKPDSWPRQAQMAAHGLWQKLKDWQDDLDGGK